MTDVIVSNKDVIVEVQQPTIPPAAPPPKIGLIEINQVVARGTAWMTGNGPPTAAGGQYGDMYLDATTGDMYQWDGTTWQYIGTFAPSTDTPAEVLAKIVTVDGSGSLLDADLLDGHDSPYFATQTDMTAVQAKNTSQDTAISGNTSSISANANAISDLQTATTPANLLTSIKTVDGSGSGLDADTLDGHDTSYFGTAAGEATLQANINLKANIASPIFTGDPQAPTPVVSDNDTSIATTAFVKSVTATIVPFPEAPSDGLTYGRKNATWSTVIGGAATSDTAPPGPLVTGQLWWKSDTGTFYVYYNDGNSSQWVEAAAPAVPAARTGAWELIGDYSFSAVASFPVINLSPFRKLRLGGMVVPSVQTGLQVRISNNNGSSFDSGAANYAFQHWSSGAGASVTSASGTTNGISLSCGLQVDAGIYAAFNAVLEGFAGTAITAVRSIAQANAQQGGTTCNGQGIGNYSVLTGRNAIQILPGAGGTITGTLTVEGVRG
jgi:hypothetical protein